MAVLLLSFVCCVQYIAENGKAFTWEELKEYNSKHPKHFNNPNNIEVSKRSYDIALLGRWILEKDNKYRTIREYGITFSKETYRAKFIIEDRHVYRTEFNGNGNWFTYNDRLYLQTTWERTVTSFDSINALKNIPTKDTIQEDWVSIGYSVKNDSSWCWKWQGDTQGHNAFLESGLESQSDNLSGEECFRKAGIMDADPSEVNQIKAGG